MDKTLNNFSISENLQIIRKKINEAEKKSGRPEGSVKLMAVSKFHSIEEIKSAINANQQLFGENRVQEAKEKFEELFTFSPNIELHIIGQLQTNKVKNAVSIATCIQSVDRIDLLKEIEKQCSKINKNIKVLFELHTGEESKSGFESPEKLDEALKLCADNNFPHIIPAGFMTMAPFTENQTIIRNSFRQLRETAEKLQKKYPQFDLSELSMGMSGDFEIAIEEGSTLVRVGTAIFGERIAN
ncbi:MAG: YggS family pyridoxal phosphate-dependent enzyme [Treponema sp.]|nr:YggS family pyridoxal phosphate-dependent enzyme [Treponema sp.]